MGSRAPLCLLEATLSKPISSVQLGVARLGIEISDRPNDADLAEWVRSFHRALALQRPVLNDYAAELLLDVENYRNAESLRKKGNPSSGFQRIPAESAGFQREATDSEHSQSASQSVSQTETQASPTRAEKVPRSKQSFVVPTLEQVAAYCAERRNKINPKSFVAKYEANGWLVGKNQMKDWKAAVRYWEQNDFGTSSTFKPENAGFLKKLG